MNDKRQTRTVWLELVTLEGQAQLTLRLPWRWALGALVLLLTSWGGPELAQFWQHLLTSIP